MKNLTDKIAAITENYNEQKLIEERSLYIKVRSEQRLARLIDFFGDRIESKLILSGFSYY